MNAPSITPEPDISLDSIEIIDEEKKYICKIELIDDNFIQANIFLNNELKYKGDIFLDKIQSQIKAFLDYNINEIYEEIKQLNFNNFSLKKEKNKYKLIIEILVLRKKKNIIIDLNENKKDLIKETINNYEKIIKEKDILISNLKEKIKKLEEQLNENIKKDNIILDLKEKMKELEKRLEEKDKDVLDKTIIEGNGGYSKLEEIINMYKVGSNSICQILFSPNNKKIKGTGFFIEIDQKFNLPFKRVLFTCDFILPEDFFKQNKFLEIEINKTNKKINIENSQLFFKDIKFEIFILNRGKRKIISNKDYHYTCIEILDTDNIFDNSNIEIFKTNYDDELTPKDIAILHYIKGQELSFSLGQIKYYDNDLPYFLHTASTQEGCLGAPLINRNQITNVIGIHFGWIKNKKGSLAHPIRGILNDIKNKIFNKTHLGNNFKTLCEQTNRIENIFIINNEKLCSCSYDGTVLIYNLKNFELEGKIENKSPVIYHCLLSNNNIALCVDTTIKIYREKKGLTDSVYQYFIKAQSEYELLFTLSEHKKAVCKVLEIDADTLASLAFDRTMIIWNRKKYYLSENFIYSKKFLVNENEELPTNSLKVKEKEIVTCGFGNNYIQFWETENFINKKIILDIKCNRFINSMIMINDNTLLIGGDNLDIYIIDSNKYELISHITKYKRGVSAVRKLNNGNILIGCNEDNKLYSLVEYNYEKGDLIEVVSKKDAHSNIITGLLELNDGEIVSCSYDQTIKFWG